MKLLLALLKPYSAKLLLSILTDRCEHELEFGNYVAADETVKLIFDLGFLTEANELWNEIRKDKEKRDLIRANQAA